VIRQHPSPNVLSNYARGALPAGLTLIVRCHVHGCEACRREVAVWESTAGLLLLRSEPLPLADGALARAFERIDGGIGAETKAARKLPGFLERFDVPAPLADQDIGSRLWLAPGIWIAPIRTGAKSASRTYFVHAERNTALPEHTHRGREFTAVLHGSFRDGSGVFEKGDFEEADDRVSHAPAVTADAECLCVISADAPMSLHGRVARMIQTLAGKRY
jgi:putative transcriptional regulator